MRIGKWVLGIAALTLLFGSVADAQIQANTLCLQSGGNSFTKMAWGFSANHGGFKYFPSYSHIPAMPMSTTNVVYPWKIAGWTWGGMQANQFGPTWIWHTVLQSSTDNPGATTMSFDYPVLYCTGTVPHSGFPMPIYGGAVPSQVPGPGGFQWVYPSSFGGFDAYLNVFASNSASWLVPSTAPFQGFDFGLFFGCGASVITVPSSDSIVQGAWDAYGPFGQYMMVSNSEVDCMSQGGSNKGRNYSVVNDADNGYLWYWLNGCNGQRNEFAMCLWVCDTVSIPINVPGTTLASNPFAPFGFDVGVGTLTPFLSSGCENLGFMTQEYTGSEGPRIALAAFGVLPPSAPYGAKKYRLPHGYDLLTSTFINIAPLFLHTPLPVYPAAVFGTTTGAHSPLVPFPADPILLCAEIKYSTFAFNNNSQSAGFQVVLW
jgi:hypothetical protein